MHLLCRSCIPKQMDLQAFFVTTAALLCQRVVADVNQQLHNTNTHYYLVPPQSILTKQI